MTISLHQAIEAAQRVAKERGWRWKEPIFVHRVRAFLFYGPPMYEVLTSVDRRNQCARFLVDLEDGRVREAYWHRR
jgi:hypothetical protein